MPIYEYRCEQGHTFEVMQRMTDDPVVSCQSCDAPVERVFHPVAVHFKGKGFYNTDYGTRKRSRELAAEGSGKKDDGGSSKSDSSKSESSSSSDSKSDSKPAEAKASSSSSKSSD
jgi:putative FmdB family regulatory protein